MIKNRCELFLSMFYNVIFVRYRNFFLIECERWQIYRVVNTLKDYAIKAVVNTVDHLGSLSYKVGDFVDEKVDEVSGTELRVSCIEQVKS